MPLHRLPLTLIAIMALCLPVAGQTAAERAAQQRAAQQEAARQQAAQERVAQQRAAQQQAAQERAAQQRAAQQNAARQQAAQERAAQQRAAQQNAARERQRPAATQSGSQAQRQPQQPLHQPPHPQNSATNPGYKQQGMTLNSVGGQPGRAVPLPVSPAGQPGYNAAPGPSYTPQAMTPNSAGAQPGRGMPPPASQQPSYGAQNPQSYNATPPPPRQYYSGPAPAYFEPQAQGPVPADVIMNRTEQRQQAIQGAFDGIRNILSTINPNLVPAQPYTEAAEAAPVQEFSPLQQELAPPQNFEPIQERQPVEAAPPLADAPAVAASTCQKVWMARPFEVTALGSNDLWLKADVLASLTNSKGESSLHGNFLKVRNGTTKGTEFYFGLDGGTGQIVAPGQEILIPLGTNHSPADSGMARQMITTKYCVD